MRVSVFVVIAFRFCVFRRTVRTRQKNVNPKRGKNIHVELGSRRKCCKHSIDAAFMSIPQLDVNVAFIGNMQQECRISGKYVTIMLHI